MSSSEDEDIPLAGLVTSNGGKAKSKNGKRAISNSDDDEDYDGDVVMKKSVKKKSPSKKKAAAAAAAAAAAKKKRKREDSKPDKVASSSSAKAKKIKKEKAPAPAKKELKELDKSQRLQYALQSFLWWNAKEPPAGCQWEKMEHAGVSFPEPYRAHRVRMKYEGKPIDLTPVQEEA